ncbi:MAG: hypothetical protein JWR26_2380 [Pedosphaera sp.]|nr:hypothetical protein [Pedosphaera sp.]
MLCAIRILPLTLQVSHRLLPIRYNSQWIRHPRLLKCAPHQEDIVFVILREEYR